MANFDQQKDEIRQQLLQRRQTDMFEIYLANLRKVGEQKGIIKIFNKEFTKLMSSTNTGE